MMEIMLTATETSAHQNRLRREVIIYEVIRLDDEASFHFTVRQRARFRCSASPINYAIITVKIYQIHGLMIDLILLLFIARSLSVLFLARP